MGIPISWHTVGGRPGQPNQDEVGQRASFVTYESYTRDKMDPEELYDKPEDFTEDLQDEPNGQEDLHD